MQRHRAITEDGLEELVRPPHTRWHPLVHDSLATTGAAARLGASASGCDELHRRRLSPAAVPERRSRSRSRSQATGSGPAA